MLDSQKLRSDLAFFRRVRETVLPVTMSQYDIASRCNLFCEGCLFFSGGAPRPEETDLGRVDAFFAGEAARGINYAYIGGAEPSLVEDHLVIASHHIPRGVIFTNGTKTISREAAFRIHVSLWGLPAESVKLRGADIVAKQIANYGRDPRAIFVFTINHENVESIPLIAQFCADRGVRLTFNHFSPPVSYLANLKTGAKDDYLRFSDSENNLMLTPDDLLRASDLIAGAQGSHPGLVLYDQGFSDWVHNPQGIYDLDENGVATNCASRLTDKIRHFDADLRDGRASKCCCPNIECASCRLYPQALSAALEPTRDKLNHGFSRWVGLWRLWCALFLLDGQP